MSTQHVYIIGSKGIPAKYGGFETFVENLTSKKVNKFNIFPPMFLEQTLGNSLRLMA